MEGGLYLNKNEQYEYSVLVDFQEGRKSRKQVALILGISERSVSRRVAKLRENGIHGIKHGNTGKTPSNKKHGLMKVEIMELIRTKYFDFNVLHLHEELMSQGYQISYMTLLNWCKEEGLAKVKKRRASKARIYRERMSNEGVLLQIDGSHHKWNGKDKWCLLSLIDDATSNLPVGKFTKGETTWACFGVLRELIENKGIPECLYSDGAGWAGGGGKRQNFSQFVRACEELGIKVIRAYSAQAKGRIERSYRTIQGRLVPELRLNKIKGMKDANRYLEQVFIPKWNSRFTVEPKDPVNKYRPATDIDLDEILCYKYERNVCNDHTISYGGHKYKIDPGCFNSLRKKAVKIHEYEAKKVFKVFYDGIELKYEKVKVPHRRWI